MTTYSLTINIDQKGLDPIAKAHQRVTLVKSVGGSGSSSQVAWVSFDPLETNVVTWTEDYFVYGTMTELEDGASIRMTSQTHAPVQAGTTSTLAEGFFTTAPGGKGSSINAQNDQGDGFNFGLAQAASVNNTKTFSALNIVPANMNQTINFTPMETVSVFLSFTEDNGVVISQVDSQALAVVLSTASPSASITLTDSNNTFHLDAAQAA